MKTILLVEDDDAFHYLFDITIRRSKLDYEVVKAFDGDEALELLSSGACNPDLILLDINMPRMTGLEFLEEWAKRSPHVIPIVAMLTSSDQVSDKQEAMRYGFVRDYILKPIDQSHLERIEQLFEQLVKEQAQPQVSVQS